MGSKLTEKKSMGLAVKLGAGIAIMAFGFLCFTVVVYIYGQGTQKRIDYVAGNLYHSTQLSGEAFQIFEQTVTQFREGVLTGEAEKIHGAAAGASYLTEKLSKLASLPNTTEEEKVHIQKLSLRLQSLVSEGTNTYGSLADGNTYPEQIGETRTLYAMTTALKQDLTELKNHYESVLQGQLTAVKQATKRQQTLGWVLFLIVVSISFAIAYFIIRSSVLVPLSSMVTATQAIAAGNLDMRVEGITGQDEVGTLALAFNQMTAQLQRILEELEKEVDVRKQAEIEVRELNTDLEARVEQRTVDLKQANTDLESSMEQLKKAQKKLVESEKMASLGGLVAGVAHEINTPVGIGVTVATHLQEQAQSFVTKVKQNQLRRTDMEQHIADLEEGTDLILSNLIRASDLTKGFKRIAADQTSESEQVFNLTEYLSDVIISLRPQFKHTEHMLELSAPNDIQVQSYPGVISQIITNFVTNSLTHAFKDIDIGHMRIEVQREGDGISIAYHDDGNGIAAEHIQKIFDPFYTTNRGGGGTGLGMSISYNLITQKLGGTIDCTSEVGAGTRFTMSLPESILVQEVVV